MRPPAAAAPSPTPPSFAAMLADVVTPGGKFPPARDMDGLADDVATLSYEHALRAQARYRPQIVAPSPPFSTESAPVSEQRAAIDARKCASVTIRLDAEENDRLRRRAAEAGMTISAYLRSCALEAEALRAEVKQTLNQLRAARETTPATLWTRLTGWKKRPVHRD